MDLRRKDTKILAALIVVVIFGGIVALGFEYGFQPTSWQTVSNIDHIYINDNLYNLGDSARDKSTMYSGRVYDKDATIKPYEAEWQSATWADSMKYMGTVATQYIIGNPVSVEWNQLANDGSGDWVPTSDQVVYQTYHKEVAGQEFFYQHLVFEVDVKVMTDGETIFHNNVFYGTSAGLPSARVVFDPEGQPAFWVEAPDHEANFEVVVAFTVQPWAIQVGNVLTEGEAQYKVIDEFMGVMSASVIEVITSPDEPDIEFFGKANPLQQKGQALSMFTTSGSQASNYYSQLQTADESILGSIKGVPTSVMVPLNGELEAGTDISQFTFLGIPLWWTDAVAVDYQIHWRVRFDVLTALGVELISGAQPTVTTDFERNENPNNPPPDFLSNFFNWIGSGIVALAEWLSSPVTIILFAVVAIVIIWIVSKFLSLFRRGK